MRTTKRNVELKSRWGRGRKKKETQLWGMVHAVDMRQTQARHNVVHVSDLAPWQEVQSGSAHYGTPASCKHTPTKWKAV